MCKCMWWAWVLKSKSLFWPLTDPYSFPRRLMATKSPLRMPSRVTTPLSTGEICRRPSGKTNHTHSKCCDKRSNPVASCRHCMFQSWMVQNSLEKWIIMFSYSFLTKCQCWWHFCKVWYYLSKILLKCWFYYLNSEYLSIPLYDYYMYLCCNYYNCSAYLLELGTHSLGTSTWTSCSYPNMIVIFIRLDKINPNCYNQTEIKCTQNMPEKFMKICHWKKKKKVNKFMYVTYRKS